MRTGNLLRHRWLKAVALLAVGAVGGGAALAVASVPDASGLIHACVNVGELTLGSGRTAVTFNVLASTVARTSVSVHDLNITKKVDKASPTLFLAAVKGTHIKTASLTLRKAGGDRRRLVATLTNVLISSDQTEASSGSNSTPTETFSLSFSKIEFRYTQQKAT